ncbi:MAG: ribose-5-phosphate isomerase [Propionibacteriaceae bacterium]|jgi:ribose 5-phosphate isomerase B|nr:ribose-5-phosphate isomerase [Propionibacteriaceae bacterium]
MKVHIGTDHAGYELKNTLVKVLRSRGYEVVDHGADAYDSDDDYPVYSIQAAEATMADPGSFGIVLGGSGNGEAIAANKVRGVRAALLYSHETAVLARKHNNANVASLGARMYSQEQAVDMVLAFLTTEFTGADRHVRRLGMIAAYEESTVDGGAR